MSELATDGRGRSARLSPAELLATIRAADGLTRAELARRTGLGRTTIAQRIECLLRHGLLREIGVESPTRGRPPSRLTFDPSAGVVLAADLGAIQARIALTNLGGNVLAEERFELAIADGPERVLDLVGDRLDALLATDPQLRARVCAVGIGVPGPVEHPTGAPVSPPIMPGWDGYPIPQHLQSRFAVPVLVDNDVNIMALGEHSTRWRASDNLLFVKVATGIGCGIIANGQIQRGSQGAAGDIGHVPVAGHDDVVCECGNRGCLEAVAGGRALARRARDAGFDAADTRDVVALVHRQEPDAIRLVREAGRRIGSVLSGFVNGLNPGVIVVGGDLADAGEQLFAGIREMIYQRSTTLATRGLEIVRTTLGGRAGVVGAALAAANHVLDPRTLDRRLARADWRGL